MNWREWFKECGKRTRSGILPEGYVNAEEEARYKAYKARLIEELGMGEPIKQDALDATNPANSRPWY